MTLGMRKSCLGHTEAPGVTGTRLFVSAIASHPTEVGGFTERRYTPMDVLELQVLLELRWRGFSIPKIRHLLEALRDVVGIRLYEAIGDAGAMALFISGD